MAQPSTEPQAPIVWANALMFALTFAAAAILVPWYGLAHGFSSADWAVFAVFL
ncbi:MAG: acyl-CoA desaturase, partial [Gammaproteobacteria bacterium]|nr:acyl-CoA desaturase [Gammaproteobacteria bacterium]